MRETVDPFRRLREAATPFRIRWRIRFARLGREAGYSLEITVTAALLIAALQVNSNEHLPEQSKLAIEILIGTLEIVFVALRIIMRRLNVLATNTLTVIPRNELSTVLYLRLNNQRTALLDRASHLADQSDCELAKHEMYGELIGLTNVITEFISSKAGRTIYAISSINVEDFEEEPLAEAYLDANRQAVAGGVTVRRLFLLDQAQAKDRRLKAIVKRQSQALFGAETNKPEHGSGARWMLKTKVSYTDQSEDFAMFANEALVTQGSASRFELTQDLVKIQRAADVFIRLWNDDQARDARELR